MITILYLILVLILVATVYITIKHVQEVQALETSNKTLAQKLESLLDAVEMHTDKETMNKVMYGYYINTNRKVCK